MTFAKNSKRTTPSLFNTGKVGDEDKIEDESFRVSFDKNCSKDTLESSPEKQEEQPNGS